jgi:L-talarate/galactarate dehydratase
MKIAHITTRVIRTPADNRLAPHVPAGNATREFVTIELQTDQGITGIGITLFGGPLILALKAAVDALAPLVIGENPIHVEAITAKLRRAASFAGPGGIFTLALAAFDIALWDIRGKLLDQPLCALVGGYRDRAPTYASGALPRASSLDELARTSTQLVDHGFKQLKMQLGGELGVAHAIERVRVVRTSIAEEIDLMADLNQRWDVRQAIAIGHRLEPYHLSWLEDVVAHDDYAGLARVTAALTTPIAAGEYHYGIVPFRHLLESHAITIVMIDVLRVGGITQWLKVAGMAEAFNLPVVSHLLPEIHVHLIAGIPNGLTIEYMPWTLGLFEETPIMEDGHLVVPLRPGLGLTFDAAAIKRYQLEATTL